jgi:hypothetical protein
MPESQPLRAVTVDGRPHHAFEATTGDVDVTGHARDLIVRVDY